MIVSSQIAAACLAFCTEATVITGYFSGEDLPTQTSRDAVIEYVQARPSKGKDPFATPYPVNESLSQKEDQSDRVNPFGEPTISGTPNISSLGGCGPETSLGRAELRKPNLAIKLCEGRFSELDTEWLFILYYITGFNEFLEERGAFMDPTGACSRAVEPRHSLNLIYEVIDFVVSGGEGLHDDSRFERMLEPFMENKWRIPLVLIELNTWKREGRLDATSVASRGMCGDPKFKLFWKQAIEYAKRVPGTEK